MIKKQPSQLEPDHNQWRSKMEVSLRVAEQKLELLQEQIITLSMRLEQYKKDKVEK